MKEKPRLIITLSPHLKGELERLATQYGCSQAEILKIGLIRLLETDRQQNARESL